MYARTITAAALAAGLFVQTQGFTQVPIRTSPSASTATEAATRSDPETAARDTWRAVLANTPVPGKGCFHVSYPNVAWESVDCKQTKPRARPVRVHPPAGVPDGVGNGNDYVADALGLIYYAKGSFIATSGVESVESVGGDGAVDGHNEYTLQLNTNSSTLASPAICAGHPGCTVWQQFVYATDQDTVIPLIDITGGLYIQYQLLDWDEKCPSNWQSYSHDGLTDCFRNSSMASLPDIAITDLGEVSMVASATPGGTDGVTLIAGKEMWSVTADDNVLNIGSVWQQAEFNVVGDGGYSQAVFNPGASITVRLIVADGSYYAPSCLPPGYASGYTGETNNLNLGSCQAGLYDYQYPDIEFTESLPSLPPAGGHSGGGSLCEGNTTMCKGHSAN
jgi:hypothetical protein